MRPGAARRLACDTALVAAPDGAALHRGEQTESIYTAKAPNELIASRAILEDQEAALARQEDDLALIEGKLSAVYDQLKQVAGELS